MHEQPSPRKSTRVNASLIGSPPNAWDDMQRYVREEIQTNPIRTTLMGVGAGYVLGGGLFSNLTARVVGTAMRFALRAMSLPLIVRGGMELGSQLLSRNSLNHEPDTE